MLEKIKEYVKRSNWTNKEIAEASGVPLHFINDVSSSALEKGTSSYKTKKIIDKHLKTLNEFFKPSLNQQKSLEHKKENSNNEKNIILNKSNYNSKSVLGGIEYTAQYNTLVRPVKILIFDIEVSPLLSWNWGRYKQNAIKVEQECQLLSYAYMTITLDGTNSILDGNINDVKCTTLEDCNYIEKDLVKGLWELFNESQVIIGFNNKRYDDKQVYKWFMKYNLNPPVPIKEIDLFKEWKKVATLSSNSLDSLNDYLNGSTKTDITVKDLWYDCLIGKNNTSYKLLKEYNKQDVVLTYTLYKRILPFLKDNVNYSLLLQHPLACPKCGHINDFEEAEYYYTNVGRYNQYKCNKCNSYLHGRYQDSTLKINDQYIDVRPILK